MGFPFSDYVELLEHFLVVRRGSVDDLERHLFSSQGKATARSRDRESIGDAFHACFEQLLPLKRQLDAAHLADGFDPVRQDNYSRELDPVELVLRACHHWDSERWPGRNGRLMYADAVYAAFILSQLERLSLRIWDEGHDEAPERLRQVQGLLDLLNAGSTRQLGLVRDARWLIQTAQSPLTKHLRPYFITAEKVSALDEDHGIETHKAGSVLAGGHLRSQLLHLSWRTGWAIDSPQLLGLTRSSNSMDMALLVRDLVPLLDAYSRACERKDSEARLVLADAIFQGMSADPELLLTRLDLLGPSTAIEDLFVDRDQDGNATYTALGEVHREFLVHYGELVGHMAEWLLQDIRAFDPAITAYSPLGVVYGFCADLFSNMVLNTLRAPSFPDLSLEDLFISRARLDEKRILSQEWARLPKGQGERDPFEHSIQWASQMYGRLIQALQVRAARPATPNASAIKSSCFYVVPRGVAIESVPDGLLPHGIASAQEHCLTSDVTAARTSGATALPVDRLVADRAEGRMLACVYSEGGWFGISKIPLTLFTSAGTDAVMTDVPSGVIDVLQLVCPELLIVTRCT